MHYYDNEVKHDHNHTETLQRLLTLSHLFTDSNSISQRSERGRKSLRESLRLEADRLPQLCTVKQSSLSYDQSNPANVTDIVQRIRVQNDYVGPLTCFD